MYHSFKKQLLCGSLLLLSAQSAQACLFAKHFRRAGQQQLTTNRIFTNFFVHPSAAKLVKEFSDTVLLEVGQTKVHAHEIYKTIMVMLIEALNDKLHGASNDQVQNTVKLVAYGAVLHKLAKEIFCALGFDTLFDDEDKRNYELYGQGYIESMLAGTLDNYLNPEAYSQDMF